MTGVARAEEWAEASEEEEKGVLRFDEAMPRGDKADNASHVGGAAHAGWHGNQGQPKTDSVRSETDPVGTVALGWAQSQFQTIFSN
jgi:hypothetical protein